MEGNARRRQGRIKKELNYIEEKTEEKESNILNEKIVIEPEFPAEVKKEIIYEDISNIDKELLRYTKKNFKWPSIKTSSLKTTPKKRIR